MKGSMWWPLGIIALASAAGVAVFSGLGAPLQPLFAFGFLLICPGMAFVRLLGVKEPLIELTLAIALSLALDTLVAETMVLSRSWSPGGALLVLMGLSMFGAALQIVTSPARRPRIQNVR